MEMRLIDISKLSPYPIDITDLPNDKCLMVYFAEDVDNAETVLTIPEKPTNGTMVMKIFNSYYAETDNEVVKIEIGGKIVEFDLDWWFAPYKEVK